MMFSYEVNEPADQAFGAVDENGTWSGMIGQILRHVCRYLTKDILQYSIFVQIAICYQNLMFYTGC